MKSAETVADDLARLIQSHYYSEDFELLSAVRHYQDALQERERELLRSEVLRRLVSEGTLVEALLCGVVRIPEAVPSLTALLDREQRASPLARALMGALRNFNDPAAFSAVERFLDSDQEMEALAALAGMDFTRALPHIARRIRKDAYLGACLHILFDRSQKIGFREFVSEIRVCASVNSDHFRERVFKALASKQENYNPFTQNEVRIIVKALEQGVG